MTSHKHLEQQLKRPDSFQQQIMKGINFVSANRSRVAMMLAPLVLVALAGYGFQAWQKHQANARRAAVAKIMSQQTEEANSVGKQSEKIQKDIDALRNPVDAKPDAAGKKPTLTADALLKISELEKQLTQIKPDHSASAAEFRKFYDSHKDSAEGWFAGISWASYQLTENKVTDVRPVVEEITKASIGHKFYQIQSRFMLASILEELGDYDASIKEIDVLNGLVEADEKPMVLLFKGQLLYFKKDPAARTVLTELIEKHGSSREAQTARSLLAELGPV